MSYNKNHYFLLFFLALYSCSQTKTISDNKSASKKRLERLAKDTLNLQNSALTKDKLKEQIPLNSPVIALLEEDDQQKLPEDDNNAVNSDESKYTDQDRAEDVVEKLLSEEAASDDQDSSPPSKFMEIIPHPRVNFWINYFTSQDRERFSRFMKNGSKYRETIEKIFVEEGVPKELFFVGLIESGYFLKAKSHASAVGPWQFIRATGKRYGLTVSKALDERRDLYKSTRAAARYFKDLYRIFGSWELSLCGYNSGEFGMMRRMRKARSQNFFQLADGGYLHPETANYVPKVMAVMYIYNNLTKFNIEETKEINPFEPTISIRLRHSHSLAKMARLLQVPTFELENLNPEIVGNYTPYLGIGKSYPFRVPNDSWKNRGEHLKLALKSGSTQKVYVDQEKQQRKFYSQNFFRETANLKKRKDEKKFRAVAFKKGQLIEASGPMNYTVKAGDHLTSIADKFGLDPSVLKNKNRLRKDKIVSGQKLVIPNKKRVYYVVQNGENLTNIAKKFRTSVENLRNLNTGVNSSLYAGQKLLVVIN